MKVESKEIIIKVDNSRIYFNPELFIPIQQTNIPVKHMTLRSREDIFWKVEMFNYKEINKCLKVIVKDYNTSDIENFDKQNPNKPIKELLFEKFDWQKLQPLLTYYKKSELTEHLFNIDYDSFLNNEEQLHLPFKTASVLADNLTSTSDLEFEQKPNSHSISEDFWVQFTDAHFILGYVTFKKQVKAINKELDFRIPNENILAEFDNIKSWFAKRLKTKKFKVTASITLTDNEVTETKASSKHIEQITPEFIDSVKHQRTLALTKEPRVSNSKKHLFTAEEIFTQIDTEDSEGNVFNQSEQDILNFFLRECNIRNKKQLAYLAGAKQSTNYKLLYTLKPNFGFLFLIEGVGNHHFVWELLNSNATYIWSIKKNINIELQFKTIETILNTIRVSGRANYKMVYKNSHTEYDPVFEIIRHENIGSKSVDDFPKWKSELNKYLT